MQISSDRTATPAREYALCPIAALRQAILAGDVIEATRTAALLAGAFAEDAEALPPAHVIDAMGDRS